MMKTPMAIAALEVPPRAAVSFYPEPFAGRMNGRSKRQLGEYFGLKNFGVNLTRLAPGSASSLRHAHARQDEFVYVVEGTPTLVTNEGRRILVPGDCVGFPCGTGNAHHLLNESAEPVLYLEIGDRTRGDEAVYPDDDLKVAEIEGRRRFLHKDGTPY
ncbi:MAG TPA: cupin domain-containing protein [Caldimonas sp.]|nr:cupin domain-containing protein [Caldimonas sp.]